MHPIRVSRAGWCAFSAPIRVDLRPRRRPRRAPHTDELLDFESADNGLLACASRLGPVSCSSTSIRPRRRCSTTWPTSRHRQPPTRCRVCAARGASSTTSRPTGRSSARTTPSATTAPASIRSSTGLALRPGPEPRVGGPWAAAGWSSRDAADTMSLDGPRHGRPPLPGIGDEDERRVYYFVDLAEPAAEPPPRLPDDPPGRGRSMPGRSRVICEWFFDPDGDGPTRLRPVGRGRLLGPHQPPGLGSLRAPAEGTRSPAYTPGRYSLMEDMVHAFDLMVADGYAADGVGRASRHATTSGRSARHASCDCAVPQRAPAAPG